MPEISLVGRKPTTKPLLDEELADEINTLLPLRYQQHSEWRLAYSLEQMGASLRTLYHNVRPSNPQLQQGYVFVIKEKAGGIFGSYSNTWPRPAERYFGNGDCFLWRKVKSKNGTSRFEGYPYTGVNDYIMYCTADYISFGASEGHYALWFDDDLYKGLSYPTQTFGNGTLSIEGPKFHIVGLEVWIV